MAFVQNILGNFRSLYCGFMNASRTRKCWRQPIGVKHIGIARFTSISFVPFISLIAFVPLFPLFSHRALLAFGTSRTYVAIFFARSEEHTSELQSREKLV